MKKFLFVIFLALLLVGCEASEGAVQTAIAETDVVKTTPIPTPKPRIKFQPTATYTFEEIEYRKELCGNPPEGWKWSDMGKESVCIISCPDGCTEYIEGCNIKGNVSFNTGEKIYHLPGGEFYNETKIDSDFGERWFCTENEAILNGWRKSER